MFYHRPVYVCETICRFEGPRYSTSLRRHFATSPCPTYPCSRSWATSLQICASLKPIYTDDVQGDRGNISRFRILSWQTKGDTPKYFIIMWCVPVYVCIGIVASDNHDVVMVGRNERMTECAWPLSVRFTTEDWMDERRDPEKTAFSKRRLWPWLRLMDRTSHLNPTTICYSKTTIHGINQH